MIKTKELNDYDEDNEGTNSGENEGTDRKLVHEDYKDAKRDIEMKENVIFSNGLNATLKLELFKANFGVDGISLFDAGKNTLISDAMYQ